MSFIHNAAFEIAATFIYYEKKHKEIQEECVLVIYGVSLFITPIHITWTERSLPLILFSIPKILEVLEAQN